MDAATEQKRRLEEKQRVEERKRETLRSPGRPRCLIREVTMLLGSGPEQGCLGFYYSHSWVAEALAWVPGLEFEFPDKVFGLHLEGGSKQLSLPLQCSSIPKPFWLAKPRRAL